MDLQKLRVFQAVTESGSFSRAGKALYLSQPSVSTHIRDLERELGLVLFDRVGRGVKLNPAGATLAEYARRIFALEHDAEQAVAAHRGAEAGRVKVSASSTPGTYILPSILGRFHQQHPGVEIELSISDTAIVERAVLHFEADLGVIGEPISASSLEVTPLMDDELVLIVAGDHPWRKRPPERPADLTNQRFIAREVGSSIRALTDSWLTEHGIQVAWAMELDRPDALNEAVTAGLGAAITTRFAVRQHLAAGDLFVVKVPDLPIRRRLNLLINPQKPRLPVVARLAELLREAASSSIAS